MGRPQAPWPQTVADLVRAHRDALWRYLRYLGCEGPLAEDLVQETFLAVYRRPFELRSPAATASYLRRAAKNLFLMEVRRRRARPAFTDLDAADAVWAKNEADDDGGSYRRALGECLKTLADRARAAIELAYDKRAPRTAIATKLAMKPEGVKTLLRRARAALRRCIEERTA